MQDPTATLLLSNPYVWLISVISIGAGAFLGSYLKKKGENLATKEDFNELKKQTADLTTTTKDIESKIDDKIWDRQRRWEMKRDALVKALQALEKADDALMELGLAHETRHKGALTPEDGRALVQSKTDAWQTAINALDFERILVKLVCGKATVDAFREASQSIRRSASKLFKLEVKNYDEVGEEAQKHILAAYNVARKELGINEEEILPQTSESSPRVS